MIFAVQNLYMVPSGMSTLDFSISYVSIGQYDQSWEIDVARDGVITSAGGTYVSRRTQRRLEREERDRLREAAANVIASDNPAPEGAEGFGSSLTIQLEGKARRSRWWGPPAEGTPERELVDLLWQMTRA
jgi:hypothetical protein